MQFTDFVPKGVISGNRADDAISLLTADHVKVQELFSQFDKVKNATEGEALEEKQRIVTSTCVELRMHMTIEEEIFYPAVRAMTDDEDMVNEAEVEHEGVKVLIDELSTMPVEDEMFNAKYTVLSEYVNHHVKDEQSEMFRRAREADIDLVELGQQITLRKRELEEAAPAVATMTQQPKKQSARPQRKSGNRGNGASAKS
jgi:Fe-S cluster assembly iron-binding protein IscA